MEKFAENISNQDKKVHIAILGSCVIRDTIDFSQETEKYVVDRFAQFVNPLTAVDRSPLLKPLGNFMYDVIAVMDKGLNLSHFRRRNMELDLTKNVMGYVAEANSEWLLIDLVCLRMTINKLSNGSYTVAPYMDQIIPEMVKQGYIADDSITISADKIQDSELFYNLDIYFDNILKYYPQDRIIFFKVVPVNFCAMKDKTISAFKYNAIFNPVYKGNSYILNKYSNMHIVEFPVNVLGDENHKWGMFPLHYVQEYYDYAYKAVDKITGGVLHTC